MTFEPDSSSSGAIDRPSASCANGSRKASRRHASRVAGYQICRPWPKWASWSRWRRRPAARFGFRPINLVILYAWRLVQFVALAMRDAAEAVAGLADGTLAQVAERHRCRRPGRRHLAAGVLGESVASGDMVESAVAGIGINTDRKMIDFLVAISPTMNSLRELAGKRLIDNDALLEHSSTVSSRRYEGAQRRLVLRRRWAGPTA